MKKSENMKIIKCKFCGRKMTVSKEAISGICYKCCLSKRKKKERIKGFISQNRKKIVFLVG